jgi:hypothetical protein
LNKHNTLDARHRIDNTVQEPLSGKLCEFTGKYFAAAGDLELLKKNSSTCPINLCIGGGDIFTSTYEIGVKSNYYSLNLNEPCAC